MIIVLKANTPKEEAKQLIDHIKSKGLQVDISKGARQTVMAMETSPSAARSWLSSPVPAPSKRRIRSKALPVTSPKPAPTSFAAAPSSRVLRRTPSRA